jgi:hypothetical protein
MRALSLPALVGMLVLPLAAYAETPVDAGNWEFSEKIAIEGQGEMPSPPRSMCLKAGEATLEKLVLPPAEEMAVRKCKAELTAGNGTAKASMVCPASDEGPGLTGNLDIKYTPTSFEGSGPIEFKMKDGSGGKGITTLTGKRAGDC